MRIQALEEDVYGHVVVGDADIEIIEVIAEHPWGAKRCPPHVHAWYELNYVYEGTMKTGFGGDMLEVKAGEFFLIPPGVEHSHEYVPDAPHRGLCLRWSVERAAATAREEDEGTEDEAAGDGSVYRLLSELRRWPPGCYPDRYGLKERLEAIFAEADSLPLVVRLSVVQFLLRIAAIREPEGRSARPASLTDAALLRKVEIHLNDSGDERMDVRRLASSLHMSYHHLARKYKRLTGKTIVGRLTEIRLARAAELLLGTSGSISSIAEVAGFGTVYYFSRVFKKKYGCSPREYRNAHSGRHGAAGE
ncbi:AraC family transcriptional regulator [Cohnella fermenti]|uniref:AraC family transcriptional regulator n=1 Tax=Cohnella fermenti TaxID=2565925 RepID=UPI001454DE88|nr:AraC family transcriptional regulator [Cohnella fermenti]